MGDYATHATKDRRLHAQKFRIELIKPINEAYLKKNIGKVLTIDNNDVQCFEKVICIQAIEKSFYGTTEDEALSASMDYWMNFFRRLENDLNVKIIKSRKQNILMTYAEWATENCELSKECEKRANRIRIYAIDGKLRYTTDWSNLHEREAHHHKTGKEDSETGNRFIEDVLDHPESPTFTQLVKIVKIISEQNKETATGLNAVVQLLKNTLPQNNFNSELKPIEKPSYVG